MERSRIISLDAEHVTFDHGVDGSSPSALTNNSLKSRRNSSIEITGLSQFLPLG